MTRLDIITGRDGDPANLVEVLWSPVWVVCVAGSLAWWLLRRSHG